ncbi:hypothetical protein BH10ACT2_BH10ACT2_03900 [soil metagenome]
MRRYLSALLILVLGSAGTACSSDSSSTEPTDTGGATTTTSPTDAVLEDALSCDPLDEQACLLPWPNNAFTRSDATTQTGRRLDIQPDSTPKNVGGVAIDVTDQNWADGFSPGSAILTFIPELDVTTTGIAPSTDIGASLKPDAPVVLLDTTTGERVAYWGELDAQAPIGEQVLMVHPATSLPEGHHFVVGMRNMRDSAANVIPRTTAFQAAIDGDPEPLERASAFREILQSLAGDDVAVDDLYLAWDFTVATSDTLAARVLHMRELAYNELDDDGAPEFTVTSESESGNVRTVDGTYLVPNFLTGDGGPGSTFSLDADGMPQRNSETPDFVADFHCILPLAAAAPVPGIVYGHGLLGSRMEVDALSFAPETGVLGACAADEIGMSSPDVPNLANILADLSHFNQQADRMQQGLLNQQFLGRLMNSSAGFNHSTAFQNFAGAPLLLNDATQFVGNSQGGVMGGAVSAISSEWSRVVLGVPGINYSLLLSRSSQWPKFQAVSDVAYTDPIGRVLGIQLIQLLWDRGENDGYAQHLTNDPYPGIEAKHLLLIGAFGDHQVANVSTEVLARTIGATVREPALLDGRSNDVDAQWGIAPFDSANPSSAVLTIWDYGTPAPPPNNLPPHPPEYGDDPHNGGSKEPRVLQMAVTFLLTGEVTDVCGASACTSNAL